MIMKVGDDDLVVTVDGDEVRTRKLMTTHSSRAEFVNQTAIGSVVNKYLSRKEIDGHFRGIGRFRVRSS